jgi:hypothetical protein
MSEEEVGGGGGDLKWYEKKNILASAAFLSTVASALAFVQIGLHLKHYSNGNHQRHILRIIFLVPIYALLSFAALQSPKHSLDLDTFRDCYESWVVYNFLALCFEYVGGPGNVQNNMSGKMLPPSLWACAREAQQVDGAYLRRSKQYALQFVFLKPLLSLISWIMHMRGQYGDSAIDFRRGYVYVLFVYNISYSFALYGLLMFYRGAYDLLKPHKPLAKFMLVKAVIFLTFWQGAFIALAVATGDVSSSEEGRATQDFLVCVEMVFASVFMHIAFPYYVYANRSGVSRFVANVGHALSVGDVLDDTVHQFGRTYQEYTLHGAHDNSSAAQQGQQMTTMTRTVGRDDRVGRKGGVEFLEEEVGGEEGANGNDSATTSGARGLENVVVQETSPYSYSISTPSPTNAANGSRTNVFTRDDDYDNNNSNPFLPRANRDGGGGDAGGDQKPPLLNL